MVRVKLDQKGNGNGINIIPWKSCHLNWGLVQLRFLVIRGWQVAREPEGGGELGGEGRVKS
jgi:hypothetical protein